MELSASAVRGTVRTPFIYSEVILVGGTVQKHEVKRYGNMERTLAWRRI